MERFSTAAFPADKARKWREVMHQVDWPVDFQPQDDSVFEADLKVAELGPLSLRRNSIPPVFAQRREEHVSEFAEQHFLLALHTHGRLILSHYGQQTDLRDGDIVLTDATAPATLEFAEATCSLALRVPASVLRSYIYAPEQWCGLPLRGHEGFTPVLKEMLVSVWRQMKVGMPEAFESTMARHLLDAMATSYAIGHSAEVGASSLAGMRLSVAKRYIERHLRDPDLNPEAVAEACHVSSRYLRRLFAAEGESISGFIQRRRLEEAARQLGNELWNSLSVTDVAYGVGFGSSAHFARAFRKHFGLTASEYRRLHTSRFRAG